MAPGNEFDDLAGVRNAHEQLVFKGLESEPCACDAGPHLRRPSDRNVERVRHVEGSRHVDGQYLESNVPELVGRAVGIGGSGTGERGTRCH
jgi:hypothetical protein